MGGCCSPTVLSQFEVEFGVRDGSVLVLDTSTMDMDQLLRVGIAEAQLATVLRQKTDKAHHLKISRVLLLAALRRCAASESGVRAHLLEVLEKLGENSDALRIIAECAIDTNSKCNSWGQKQEAEAGDCNNETQFENSVPASLPHPLELDVGRPRVLSTVDEVLVEDNEVEAHVEVETSWSSDQDAQEDEPAKQDQVLEDQEADAERDDAMEEQEDNDEQEEEEEDEDEDEEADDVDEEQEMGVADEPGRQEDNDEDGEDEDYGSSEGNDGSSEGNDGSSEGNEFPDLTPEKDTPLLDDSQTVTSVFALKDVCEEQPITALREVPRHSPCLVEMSPLVGHSPKLDAEMWNSQSIQVSANTREALAQLRAELVSPDKEPRPRAQPQQGKRRGHGRQPSQSPSTGYLSAETDGDGSKQACKDEFVADLRARNMLRESPPAFAEDRRVDAVNPLSLSPSLSHISQDTFSMVPSVWPTPLTTSCEARLEALHSSPSAPTGAVSVRVVNGVSGEEEVRFPCPIHASFSEQGFMQTLDRLCQQHAGQALSELNWLSQANAGAKLVRRKCDIRMVENLRGDDGGKRLMVLFLCTVPITPPSELLPMQVRLRSVTPCKIASGTPHVRVVLVTSLLEAGRQYSVAFTHQWSNMTHSAEASLLQNRRGVELSMPWQMLAGGDTTEGLYDIHLVIDKSHRSENRRTLTVASPESELSCSSASAFEPIRRS